LVFVFDAGRIVAIGSALAHRFGRRTMKSAITAAWRQATGAFLLAVLLVSPVAGEEPEISSLAGQLIELLVGHGRVLRLNGPAESVYVGDTTIADLRIVAPAVVYVMAGRSARRI